jgi:hypothetical protein
MTCKSSQKRNDKPMPSTTRRFPPPWSIDELTESFIVKDATGQALAHIYFEDELQRQRSTKRLSREEAFLIAVNIAKLPRVPRQILKDIPRPKDSASQDD